MAEPIKSLAKAQAVVDLLRRNGALTPSEIADGIAVPRSSAYRLIDGLRAIELVVSRPDGSIDLAQRWLRLSDASRAARTEWAAARDVLDGLARTTGFTAYLTVPRSGAAVCLDWARGRGIELLVLRPGGSLALNAGAASRVLRAHLPAAERGEIVSYTPFTLTDPGSLAADAEAVHSEGFVLAAEDVTVGITSLAVPVFDERGGIRASLSVGGLSRDVRDAVAGALPALREAATALG
jgi:DNA-binding IclR family transcriptional regulator